MRSAQTLLLQTRRLRVPQPSQLHVAEADGGLLPERAHQFGGQLRSMRAERRGPVGLLLSQAMHGDCVAAVAGPQQVVRARWPFAAGQRALPRGWTDGQSTKNLLEGAFG